MAHKLDSEKKLWEKAAAFHGHVCPGLTIGYRAALYAIDLLGLIFPIAGLAFAAIGLREK